MAPVVVVERWNVHVERRMHLHMMWNDGDAYATGLHTTQTPQLVSFGWQRCKVRRLLTSADFRTITLKTQCPQWTLSKIARERETWGNEDIVIVDSILHLLTQMPSSPLQVRFPLFRPAELPHHSRPTISQLSYPSSLPSNLDPAPSPPPIFSSTRTKKEKIVHVCSSLRSHWYNMYIHSFIPALWYCCCWYL